MKKMDRMKIRVKRTTVMIVRHSASHSGPVEGQSDKRRHCDPLRCYRPGAGITLPPLLCSLSHSRNTGLETAHTVSLRQHRQYASHTSYTVFSIKR